jgi:hypothetical protein
MSKLQAIQIDEDTIIYVEATDAVAVPVVASESEEVGRTGQKGLGSPQPQAQIAKSFQAIEGTIKTYTKHTLNAFKDAALADVEKVTIEFGMNVSGGAGVPYIAAGTVGCNIKVTVECNFAQRNALRQAQQAQQTVPVSARAHSGAQPAAHSAHPAGHLPQTNGRPVAPHSVAPH